MGHSKIEVILLMIESWLKSPMSCDIAIKNWISASFAARTLGLNQSLIIQCCKGTHKTTGGFIWKYSSDELRDDEISIRNVKVYKNKKHIAQYLKDGTFICEYDSAASASLATNVRETYIYRCRSGSRASAGGYVWKYVDM